MGTSVWKKYFIKNGGYALLKQYLRQGTFWVALNQFLVIGRNKKALELLRLSVSYKFYKKIKNKYSKRLTIPQKKPFVEKQLAKHNKNLWICWWQGIENAPEIVKICFNSVQYYFKDWNITVITRNNYKEYVDFPNFILSKWEKGVISDTHMSDLLRLELLIRYGGLWLDATILCTSKEIPESILNSELFFYQCLKPGADGHTICNSNWLLYAQPFNTILETTQIYLYDYWKKNNDVIDYFIFHYFLRLACEMNKEKAEQIPQFSNALPHILLLSLFKQFDSTYWIDLCKMTCFHKLSYKLDPDQVKSSQGTYYNYVMSLRYGMER